MRFRPTLITLCFLLSLTTGSYCQTAIHDNRRIETLSMEHGLSSSNIHSITQDNDGFIWIGTDVGLNRYDGYKFEIFQYEIDKKTSLSHSFIKDIIFDNRGALWIATWGGGINLYDSEKQLFRGFLEKGENASNDIHDHIEFIHQAKDGTFWFGTLEGLIYYNPVTKNYNKYLTQITDPLSISDNRTTDFLERSDGTMMFVGYDGVLNVFNHEENNFRRYEIRESNGRKEVITITYLFEDSNQTLLAGTSNGIYVFNELEGRFANAFSKEMERESFYSTDITDIVEYFPGKLWIGTDGNGIVEIVKDEGDNVHYKLSGKSNVLPDIRIEKIFKDIQGNIWIGTNHNGLKVIYNKKKHFSYIKFDNNQIHAVTIDPDNNLWVGSSDGLYKYNLNTKEKKKYTVNSGLSSNNIRSLFADGKNRLLVGTESGLDVLDKRTGKITLWREENGILNAPIVTITKDKRGNYWMGSDLKGLVFIDGKTGEVSNYIASSDKLLIGTYNVTSICFENEDSLWVGIYGGGVNLFDTKKREFVKRNLHDPTNKNSINDNNVLDIHKDKNNNIWIATVDGGLSHFDPETSVFNPYLKKDGLPSNSVYSIIDDNSENLWIGTHNGLAKFNVLNNKIKYFNGSDGLVNNQFVSRAKIKDSDGVIYLGTNKGVVYFKPEEIKENIDEPRLQLTDFMIYNKPIDFNDKSAPLQNHISHTDSMVLKHDQTAISIEYVALNYISSKKNRYSYIMEGLENEWREVGDQRMANYSNLAPGEYTFKLKGSNNDDVWTSEPLLLYIKVLPPFWRSTMAYSIYLILFFMLNFAVVLFVKWVTKRDHDMKLVQIDRDKDKQLMQFKLQFFTNISHELRTHLTLIVYPINKLLKKRSRSREDKTELDRIDLNVSRLLKLTDEIIDFRKVEQGKTNLALQNANIIEFLHEIKRSFNPISEEHGISFEFKSDLQEVIWCFDHEKLNKIIFNLLSNAFKYTPDGGKIKISVSLSDENDKSEKTLRISVEDNGIGIDKDHLPQIFDRFFNPGKNQQQHYLHDSSGIGLALVKQLVELHGGQMYVESERGKGSHFYFDLTELCDDCIDNETALSDVKMNSDRYEKWEEMLKLERSNIQDELIITNDLKSAELPAVLVVDDNKEICQALNDTLKEKYKIYIADNGKKALGVVDKENIDIVISDIMMPELDGIGLCKELKSNIKTSHIPVVLITAKSGIDNELAGLRTGADAYITKPFNYEKVLLVVENIIDGKKKVQKLLKGKEIGEELEPGLNPLDMKLIEKINQIISLKITDANFSVDELGREAGLSRMHLFRKIKALTGYSPSDFIKKSRLERSKELIEKGELSISEIAYDTGFSTPGNFSTAFKKFFGQTPAQYRAECFSSSCK